MKLLKCRVAAFGKLKDFTYEFNDKINSIKEDNGWGKSTLTVFIKSMFYGLNGGKKSVEENERIKYRPWGTTDRFGGYVDFLRGEKSFRIERYFGSKESEDTIRLTDLITGKEYYDTKDLGKRIFSIDENGFLSTVYFAQRDFEIKSNDSLTAKFNDMQTENGGAAVSAAVKKIEDKAKLYKGRAEKGLYFDCKRELFAVNAKIDKLFSVSEAVQGMKEDIVLMESQISDLKSRTEELSAKVSVAGKAEADAVRNERYKYFLNERQALLEEKKEYERVFCGNPPDIGEIDTCIDCCRGLFDAQSAENNVAREIAELKNKKTVFDENNAKKKTISIALLTIAALMIIGGAAAVFFNVAVGAGVTAVGVAALAVWGGVYSNFRKHFKNDEITPLLNKKYREAEEYIEIKEKYDAIIKSFIGRYNLPQEYDYFSALSYLREAGVKNGKCEQALAENAANVEKYRVEIIDRPGLENLSSLREKLKSAQELYADKTFELAQRKATVAKYEEMLDELPELRAKKSELFEKAEEINREYDILTLTAGYLKKADENLKTKYRAPLETSFNKYLSLITGRPFANARIDVDLNVTVEESSGAKVTDYYSKGYRNIFEICKRFALTDVLFKNEKPFIILDDPFYNLDDEKLTCALDLIKSLSEEYQILYLVCHESRRLN